MFWRHIYNTNMIFLQRCKNIICHLAGNSVSPLFSRHRIMTSSIKLIDLIKFEQRISFWKYEAWNVLLCLPCINQFYRQVVKLISCCSSLFKRCCFSALTFTSHHCHGSFSFFSQSKIPYGNIFQWGFTCSKLTLETLEQGVKYVQS